MKKTLCLLMSLMLGACMMFACKPDDGKTHIRLSEVTHSIFYAPMYIAINKGFFDGDNIKVELSNGGGADKVMTALTSKSADIGLMGPEATVYVVASGKKDYPVVFGQLTKRDGSFLVGRTSEPNFDWNNLKGKRVLAGRRAGMPAMTLQYVCNQKGMQSPADLNLDMDVQFDMMAPVFESDPTVAYTTMFEPLASEYAAKGKGFIVASVGQDSGEVPYTAFSATKSYIESNKDTVKAFLKGIMKGFEFMKTADINDVVTALQPSFSTTPAASIKAAIESYLAIDAWCDTPVMSEESFNRLQDIMENAGELKSKADFTKVVDNTYAAAVMAELAA